MKQRICSSREHICGAPAVVPVTILGSKGPAENKAKAGPQSRVWTEDTDLEITSVLLLEDSDLNDVPRKDHSKNRETVVR